MPNSINPLIPKGFCAAKEKPLSKIISSNIIVILKGAHWFQTLEKQSFECNKAQKSLPHY